MQFKFKTDTDLYALAKAKTTVSSLEVCYVCHVRNLWFFNQETSQLLDDVPIVSVCRNIFLRIHHQ